jgi:hypothetical protein
LTKLRKLDLLEWTEEEAWSAKVEAEADRTQEEEEQEQEVKEADLRKKKVD